MIRSGWGKWLPRVGLMFGALAASTGCAAGIGVGVGAALITVGIITHECYEYVNITVIDGATGARTCNAHVTAQRGTSSPDDLGSCYYAPLTDGKWTIRATLPQRAPAESTIEVKAPESCEPAVATIVITIPAPGGPVAPRPLVPAPALAPPPVPAASSAAPPATAPEPPIPTPTPTSSSSAAPAPPSAAPPPAGPPASALPPAPPAPPSGPVQRFPDQP